MKKTEKKKPYEPPSHQEVMDFINGVGLVLTDTKDNLSK